MGCICSRSSAVEDSRESPEVRKSSGDSSELGLPRFDSSRRENELRLKDISFMFIDKNVNDSMWLHDDDQIERTKKRAEKPEFSIVNHPGFGRVPKAMVGEQVAAGWPNWLSAVAGEAIKGWVPLCEENFEKIDKIGQGTYSNVFKARDASHNKIVALKKVRFDCLDADSVKFMAREIIILRRLDHPNVIKLEGLITSRTSSRLYLVFEYMEHDLTGLASRPGLKFAESQVKCYAQQLLNGLDHCHSHGVLHRDIKGSNLLISNNGILKIADFGLASYFNSQSDCPLTSRVVTLWYRPPELLLGACHYDEAVDLWSTGCVLGELFAGKPILPGKTEVEQLHKIFRLCGSPSEDYWRASKLPHSTVFKPLHPYKRCVSETFRHIPATAVRLLETLLSVDPADRGTAARALSSEFFTTKPLACDPSSLPKYPPSKEIDVNVVEEETRRREACGAWRRESKGPRETQGIPAPNVKTDLAMLMQQTRGHASSTSHGRISHSGPLVPRNGYANARKEHDNTVLGRSKQSSLSGSVATRTIFPDEKSRPLQAHASNQMTRSHRSLNVPDSLQIRRVCEAKGSKVYASGPSNNVSFQEFSRRACLDKTRLERGTHLEGKQVMVDL